MLRKIKKNTINTLKSSSTHGISQLFRTRNFLLRIMWIVLLIFSSSCAIYFVCERVMEYLEFKVTTEVRLEDTSSMDFPTITICDKNKMSTQYSIDKLKYFLEKELTSKNLNQLKSIYSNTMESKSKLEFFKAVSLFKINPAFLLKEVYPLDQLKNVTSSINEMLLSCKFNGETCTEKDFEWIFNEKYGNCYRFNWNFRNNSVRKIGLAGKENGLILNLYVGLPKEINSISGLDRGVYVSIDSFNSNPFIDLNDIIDAQAGLNSQIVIQRSEFHKYPKPYSNCEIMNHDIFSSSVFKTVIEDFGYSYSQSLCLEFCKNDIITKLCSCTHLLSSMHISNLNSCQESIKNSTKCLELERNDSLLNSMCSSHKLCPLECDKVKFDHSMTLSIYPSFLAELVKSIILERKDLTPAEKEKYRVEKDLVRLQIFYGSMSYLKYRESPSMTVFALISSIGGTLGLFMGMSVLSFAEVFDIIFQALLTIKNERKKHDTEKIIYV